MKRSFKNCLENGNKMPRVNVMKNVKTRKQPVWRKALAPPPKKEIVFRKNNPWKTFADIPMEDMSEAIDYYISKMDPPRRSVIDTLNRVKNLIPWIRVKEFFSFIGPNKLISDAFDDFVANDRVAFDVRVMKNELAGRQLMPFSPLPQQRVRRDILALPPPTKKFGKFLKYDKKDLIITPLPELRELAQKEQISGFESMEREQLIENLLLQTVKNVPRTERQVVHEHESKCVSAFKRAPWIRGESIGGMVVNPSINPALKPFATSFEQEPGWFRVTKSWYEKSCEGTRLFFPDSVGYFSRSGKIIVETRQIFDDSQSFVKNSILFELKLEAEALGELGSKCVREFKTAPWFKSRTPIWGMAIDLSVMETKADAKAYLSGFVAGIIKEPNWAEVNDEWYEMACNGNRTFIPHTIGYFTAGGNKIFVETAQMFDASQTFVENARQFQHRLPRAPEKKREEVSPGGPEKPSKIAKNIELAPGLFSLVSRMIEGTLCLRCKAHFTGNPWKSVWKPSGASEGKKVIFCGKACMEKFNFEKAHPELQSWEPLRPLMLVEYGESSEPEEEENQEEENVVE